ncbi:MAG: DUF1648 domain-containing protein, partial [Verrucomicrobiaceae bacterium]
MNANRRPLIVFVLCLCVFFLTLLLTGSQLPERVASHFNGSGVPDGWMSRSEHLWTVGGIAVGLSALMLILFYCLRFLPVAGINLPNKSH